MCLDEHDTVKIDTKMEVWTFPVLHCRNTFFCKAFPPGHNVFVDGPISIFFSLDSARCPNTKKDFFVLADIDTKISFLSVLEHNKYINFNQDSRALTVKLLR